MNSLTQVWRMEMLTETCESAIKIMKMGGKEEILKWKLKSSYPIYYHNSSYIWSMWIVVWGSITMEVNIYYIAYTRCIE